MHVIGLERFAFKKKVINFYIPGWCLLGAGSLLGLNIRGDAGLRQVKANLCSVTLYSNSALSQLEGK